MAAMKIIINSKQITERFFKSDTVQENGKSSHDDKNCAVAPEELKPFLRQTGSYITGLSTTTGELLAEVLCFYTDQPRANRTFKISVLDQRGEVTDHENVILGDREFQPFMARRIRMPLLLIDLIDFTLLATEERLRSIIALRATMIESYRAYQKISRRPDWAPVIKFHSTGDGFYVIFGQSDFSSPSILFGQILLQQLRQYNLGVGLHNKLYFRMVCHYGDSNILGGVDTIGSAAVETLFIGEIFNDCARILSSCPRNEANLLYATEVAYDYFQGDRSRTFSELKIAVDKNNLKYHYHIVDPDTVDSE